MSRDKTLGATPPKTSTRDRVLDAAERLLADGRTAFAMRELAETAGVSFATPFNQFGSKGAIMLALSARRIDAMRDRLARADLPEAAVPRVLQAVEIAASVMLDAPDVNRAVMAAIGAPGEVTSDVAALSSALWVQALGGGEGLAPATRALALAALPRHLATAFRGVLSFWTAGEISDAALPSRAGAAAAAMLLGFADRDARDALLARLER